MALVMTAAPSVEPISRAEAKAHLRIDASDEDSLLSSLITAGRMFVERTLSLALITETWSFYLDGWPRSGTIALPIQPVRPRRWLTPRVKDCVSETPRASWHNPLRSWS